MNWKFSNEALDFIPIDKFSKNKFFYFIYIDIVNIKEIKKNTAVLSCDKLIKRIVDDFKILQFTKI